MKKSIIFWKEQFPQLPLEKKLLFCLAAAVCAVGCLALLAVVLLALVVAVLLIIKPNIAPSGPLYMDVPSMYASSLWVAEDDSFAFVADSVSSGCGLQKDGPTILDIRIDYKSAEEPKTVQVYATRYTQWTDDEYIEYKMLKSQELLYTGVVYYIDTDHVKMKLQGSAGDRELCFERKMYLSDKYFEFEEELTWPVEMLQWMEQNAG